MAALSELLERFRHAGAPGAPAPAGGVPADTAADLEAELRFLFAALDEVDEEARATRREAEREAEGLRERAARQARRIVAEARARAAELRVSGAPAPGLEGDEEARAILAGAEAEASAIRERARDRMPGLVARVVRCVAAGPVEDGGGAGVGGG